MKSTMIDIIHPVKYMLILFGMIVFIASCDFDTYNTASPQCSSTIEEAKEREVFIQEYIPNKYTFRISKDSFVNIEETWVEKVWFPFLVVASATTIY